jgi:hypothetical protein
MAVTDFAYIDPIRLEIDPVRSPHKIHVWSDFRVAFKIDGVDTIYTVRAGMETDFASIPRQFEGWLIEKIGAHMAAAVVHDQICVDRGPWSSKVAADIFNEAMRASRVPDDTRTVMYQAVLLGGPQWG